MRRRENGHGSVGVGASSILLVFLVLCLTTLGVLSLTSARADRKLTEQAQAAALAYYVADTAAQEKLAQLDAALIQAGAYRPEDETLLETVAGVTLAGDTAAFSVSLTDGRTLQVTVRLLPAGGRARYEVEEYRLLPAQREEAGGGFSLWQGEE